MVQPNDSQSSNRASVADLAMSKSMPSKHRLVYLVAGIALVGSGIAALATPFLGASPRWEWNIQTKDDLNGAEVNAVTEALDQAGLVLSRKGDRQISLISKPLTGLSPGRPVVEVLLATAPEYDFPEPAPPNQRVILFWQTAPNEAFRMQEQTIAMHADDGPVRVTFIPPVDARAIHRIGVQCPGVFGIRICQLRMIDTGLKQRIEFFRRDCLAEEPFGGDSVNYYKGPNLLGRSLNHYLAGLCAAAVGLVLAAAAATRRRVTRVGIVLAMGVPWLVGDIVFSTQLVNRAVAESGALRTLSPAKSLAAVYGDGIANAIEPLKRLPYGSRVAVLADDGVASGHRLAYWGAPNVVLVERPQQAEFIVVLGTGAEIVNVHTLRTKDTHELITVRLLDSWIGGGWFFARIHD